MAAAARRSKKGEESFKTIDMSYTEKDGVDPNASTPFIKYHQATPYNGGHGHGGRDSGEEFIHCNALSNYLTSITNDADNHLIFLSIKVAEAEVEEDVDLNIKVA